MQENEVDFWPSDLAQEDASSPVAILRQQAEALAAHTGHKLRARVATQPDESGLLNGSNWKLAEQIKPFFRHRLVIVVPALEDYELDLVSLYQGMNLYPIAAHLVKQDNVDLLEDEPSLKNWLKKAFSSPATRNSLRTLLSMAN